MGRMILTILGGIFAMLKTLVIIGLIAVVVLIVVSLLSKRSRRNQRQSRRVLAAPTRCQANVTA